MALDNNTPPDSDTPKNGLVDSESSLTEIVQLSDIVSSDSSLLGGDDVTELLQRLADAETMADGMESKIDSILENLDNLLGALDGAGGDKSTVNVAADVHLKATLSSGGQNDEEAQEDSLSSA